MRDEDEVQSMVDEVTDTLNDLEKLGKIKHTREYLRGLQAALDWVIDEGTEDLL